MSDMYLPVTPTSERNVTLRPIGLCAGKFPEPDAPLSVIPDLNDEIRRERDRLAEKLSCGHRKVDWDDSYGGCVACSAIKAMHEIDGIEKERDELLARVQARVKELDLNLGNILAVIHGDGGHYYVRHGAEKATKDAIARYYKHVTLLNEVACSAVEFEDERVGYVSVQIDRETWLKFATIRELQRGRK